MQEQVTTEQTEKKDLMVIREGRFMYAEIKSPGELLREKLKAIKIKSERILVESKKLVTIENGKFILTGADKQGEAKIYLQDANDFKKEVEKIYKSIKDPINIIKKKILQMEKDDSKDSSEIKTMLSQGIGEYNAKLRREAEEKARIERERIEAERLAEAQRKQEEAEKLKKTGTPEAMQQAINLETEAEDILDAPEPVVKVETPEKLSGIKQRRFVKCAITNPNELLKFIIKTYGMSRLEFLQVNESAIRQYVKQMDGKVKMPGLRVWEEFKATT